MAAKHFSRFLKTLLLTFLTRPKLRIANTLGSYVAIWGARVIQFSKKYWTLFHIITHFILSQIRKLCMYKLRMEACPQIKFELVVQKKERHIFSHPVPRRPKAYKRINF